MSPSGPEPGMGQFHPTHWSVVLTAGDSQSERAHEALETLCRTYWYPLYAFVRRQGHAPHEAQDLTQGFFAALLEKKALGKVDPDKGKFRSFLLASLNNFLNNERDKAHRLKRGGGIELLSLDAEPAEERYQIEAPHNESPEKIFERRWANAVVEAVVRRLRSEFAAVNQVHRFEVLKGYLLAEPRESSYDDAARQLGLSVSAVTSAIHRMRLRFRELFRAEIANTVGGPEEVDEEIRHLLAVLSG